MSDRFMKAEERAAFYRAAQEIGDSISADDLEWVHRKIERHPSYWPTLVLANPNLARHLAETMT